MYNNSAWIEAGNLVALLYMCSHSCTESGVISKVAGEPWQAGRLQDARASFRPKGESPQLGQVCFRYARLGSQTVDPPDYDLHLRTTLAAHDFLILRLECINRVYNLSRLGSRLFWVCKWLPMALGCHVCTRRQP